MASKTKAFELRSTDKPDTFNLFLSGRWVGLVETSKAPARKTNFRLHGGRGNWTDFVGTKKEFETHARTAYAR